MTTADRAGRLEFYRTRVTFDQTMMSWIRTGTSLITFGFTVYKFFQIDLGRTAQVERRFGAREFALLLVLLGLASLVVGIVDHRRSIHLLLAEYPGVRSPMSRIEVIAGCMIVLGLLALVVVIVRV